MNEILKTNEIKSLSVFAVLGSLIVYLTNYITNIINHLLAIILNPLNSNIIVASVQLLMYDILQLIFWCFIVFKIIPKVDPKMQLCEIELNDTLRKFGIIMIVSFIVKTILYKIYPISVDLIKGLSHEIYINIILTIMKLFKLTVIVIGAMKITRISSTVKY